MDGCVFCENIALYKCQPCTASFCEEHKRVHENIKNRPHIFESIKPKPDQVKYAKIVESLATKIKELETFKSRITLETKTLIKTIEELRSSCIKKAEGKVKSCINLLKQFQNPELFEDLAAVENQLSTFVCLYLPFPSIKEIENFYNYEFYRDLSFAEEMHEKFSKFKPVLLNLEDQARNYITKASEVGISGAEILNNDQYIPPTNSLESELSMIYKTIREISVTTESIQNFINEPRYENITKEISTLNQTFDSSQQKLQILSRHAPQNYSYKLRHVSYAILLPELVLSYHPPLGTSRKSSTVVLLLHSDRPKLCADCLK